MKNNVVAFYKENGENHIITVLESNNGLAMLTDENFLKEVFSKHPKANGNLYVLIGSTEIKLDHFDAFGSQQDW